MGARGCDLSAGLPSTLLDAPPSDASAGRTMVTASALADLVSRPWFEAFADGSTAADHVTAVLLATVCNGVVSFAPSDPDDAEVIAAFHRNMKREKGFGPAPGADAADWGVRRKRLRAHGDLEIRVGHTDLLAVRPAGDDSAGTRRSSSI